MNDREQRIAQLKTFDYALPQEWFDNALRVTGINPAGHIVWCYDDAKMFGAPMPIDEIGDTILADFSNVEMWR